MPRAPSRFIVPARFACKITVCEGVAAMVAKKTTGSTPAEPAGAGEAGSGKRTSKKAEGAADAAQTTGATTVVAKKSQGTATAAQQPGGVPKARESAVEAGELAVRPGEDPWTPEEVDEARAELQSEAMRLGSEIEAAEAALAGLMRDSGDGAGDDEADTGTKNITREHEMALAANAREMLLQTQRALERLDAGTYGLCENCGNPIGKARMQAFPRATLCVECKQKQERRY
ncbi:TraR/DksA family transcriptional regulator [Streptomyces sp. NPDC046939]|uniref:TraR/DksA family transcriptional regulator n=1 Tax=Streptomyces sp. NPDC046939 TaxID=3155376 RepID=UPI0033F99835